MLTIYKASAGSGKTFRLAYEYIKLLLCERNEDGSYRLVDNKKERRRHRSILAITFTNKATEEMKSRIVHELRELCASATTHTPSQYAIDLTKETGCSYESLAKAAHTALEQLLFDFNFFNISTIDSFFQLVLRTFAREVDKPGNYDVELNDYYAMSMAAAAMLRELDAHENPAGTPVGSWIKQLMTDKLADGDKFNIFDNTGDRRSLHGRMVSFMCKINDEVFRRNAAAVEDYLHGEEEASGCRGRIHRFRKSLVMARRGFRDELTADSMSILEKYGDAPTLAEMTGAPLAKRVEAWASGKIDFGDVIVKISNAAEGRGIFLAKYKSANPEGLAEALTELCGKYLKYSVLDALYLKILDSLYYLGLMGYATEYVERFRKENNLILLSDTNSLISTIINGSDAPFIYERLGVRLHHFLIDEFQDTSVSQWDNLRPLVMESLANKYDNLIIGDEKQSIYRFRNADSELLHSAVAQQVRPHPVAVMGENPGENTNHRSREQIVQFNNGFFSRLAEALREDTYGNVIQDVCEKRKKSGGHVSLISCGATNAAAFGAFANEYTVREIMRFRRQGFRFRDMTILVNRNDDGDMLASYILENHPEIAIMSDESLLLSANSSVRLLISVLRLIQSTRVEQPDAGDSKYATSREVALTVGRLQYLVGKGMTLEQALEAFGGREDARDMIGDIAAHGDSTLISLVEYIEDRLIDHDARERDKAFILAFNDCVADFCYRRSSDLYAFLRWWGINNDKLTVPSSAEQDAVRVMTVHKSKGLQSECVIVPFFNTNIVSSYQEDWYTGVELEGPAGKIGPVPPVLSLAADNYTLLTDRYSPFREQALAYRKAAVSDMLNLTYVAFTRAISELTVIGGRTADENKVSHWLKLATDAEDWKTMEWADADGEGKTVKYEMLESGVPVTAGAAERGGDSAVLTRQSARFASVFRDDLGKYTRLEYEAEYDADKENSRKDASSDQRVLRRGNAIHEVLSRMQTIADLDYAFECVAYRRRLDDRERAEYRALIDKAFARADERICGWFSDFDYVLNERTIHLPEAWASRFEDVANRRPDRVVWRKDGSVEIVDFKISSNPYPEHSERLRCYITLLRSMGFGKIRAFLWYLPACRVEEVFPEEQ